MSGDYVMVEKDYENVFKQRIELSKTSFYTDFLEKQRASLGSEEFEKRKEKLQKEVEKRWRLIQEAKSKLFDLEERMHTEIMEWSAMEKLYHQWLEARDEPKNIVENTIKARQQEFETAQFRLKDKLKSQVAEQNIEENFRRRLLDPKERQQAFQLLHDRVDKSRFLLLALDCLFEEIDKLRRR